MYFCDLPDSSLGLSSVRRKLRDDLKKAEPDDFPRLLYRNGSVNQADLFDGFLRNKLLVKVHLFIVVSKPILTRF